MVSLKFFHFLKLYPFSIFIFNFAFFVSESMSDEDYIKMQMWWIKNFIFLVVL